MTATGINWTNLAVLLASTQAKAAAPARTYSVYDWLHSTQSTQTLKSNASVVLPWKKGPSRLRMNTAQSSAVR